MVDDGATAMNRAMMRLETTISRGIVAILLMAGIAGCAENSSTIPDEDRPVIISRMTDPVVARVEGTLIYASDVQRAAAAQGLIGADSEVEVSDPVFRVTVEELIDQRLLALDARRTGVAQQEEAQRRLAAARERILGNLRVETYLAETVNDETIRELYEAQKSLSGPGEERRARQIVVADEETAKAVVGRLNDEEDFAALVTELSIDSVTRDRGGELGWLSRDVLPAPLRSPVFTTDVGARAEPVQTDAGWHIIEVLDRRVPNQRSFEDTREDIVRFMTFDAIEALMTDLRDQAEVERLYQEDAPESDTDAEE